MQSRYSNRTVTLRVHSPKYSNRRVTKKTAQLQSNREVQLELSHPVDSSARIKSPCIIFVLIKILCFLLHKKETNTALSWSKPWHTCGHSKVNTVLRDTIKCLNKYNDMITR